MSGDDFAQIFVVSSGRCGSTMLSEALGQHPELLSLSEFFITVQPGAFPAGPVSGERFWTILSRPIRRHTLMYRLGIMPAEFLYRPGPGTRFTTESGVPPLMVTTLLRLFEDPDLVYDELAEWAPGLDARPIEDQYLRLFAWLCERRGRVGWVERSGSSLTWLPRLIAGFPQARFVHLYRDGRECAMSMSRHTGFKVAMLSRFLQWRLGVDPFNSEEPAREEPPDWLRPFLPQTFDRERFLAFQVPIEEHGKHWSQMVVQGREHLDRLEPGRVLHIRYEALVEDPVAELSRLVRFIGVAEDRDWLDRVASLPGRRPLTWLQLRDEERSRLEEACAPGMRLLYGDAVPRAV